MSTITQQAVFIIEVSGNSEQTLMSTVALQTMSITVEADQSSFQPCSRGGDQSSFQSYSTGEGHDAIFAKRHGAQAKERDVRIDLLTAGTCMSLMMQDSQRSCEIALARRRDGEDCHSSCKEYISTTEKWLRKWLRKLYQQHEQHQHER